MPERYSATRHRVSRARPAALPATRSHLSSNSGHGSPPAHPGGQFHHTNSGSPRQKCAGPGSHRHQSEVRAVPRSAWGGNGRPDRDRRLQQRPRLAYEPRVVTVTSAWRPISAPRRRWISCTPSICVFRKPPVSHQVIGQLIGSTTTDTGSKVACEIHGNLYPKGNTGLRQGDGRTPHQGRQNSPRVELHHLARTTTSLKQ
jgi:hypothetical protein